jgi:response regulator NasT
VNTSSITSRSVDRAPAEPVDFAPNARTPVGERQRIVIADDHEPTRVLLRTLIKLEGMQLVGEAGDGGKAVELALEREPHVVVLDVDMPGLDGLGAAEIIKASRPAIRLLLHTGRPLDAAYDRAAALQLPLADTRDLHITIRQLARSTETRATSAMRPGHLLR